MRRSPSKSELRKNRDERQKKLREELEQIEREQEERINKLRSTRRGSSYSTASQSREEREQQKEQERQEYKKKQEEELKQQQQQEEERKAEALNRIKEAEKNAAIELENKRKQLAEQEAEALKQGDKEAQERNRLREEMQKKREEELRKRKEEILRRREEKVKKESEEITRKQQELEKQQNAKKQKEEEIKREREKIIQRQRLRKSINVVRRPLVSTEAVQLDKTRIVANIAQPINSILSFEDLEITEYDVDFVKLRYHLSNQGRLSRNCVITILDRVLTVFKTEPNVLRLKAPIIIVGDTHGQFYDLCHLLDMAGDPELHTYLFLGDYIDRGFFSLETLIYLFTIKITIPDSIFLLRGNHETRETSKIYSFIDEILHKYDKEIYDKFMTVLDALPLAAIVSNVQGDWFCCHGGLSEQLTTIADIEQLERFEEPQDNSLVMDLLWSDPLPEDSENQNFKRNRDRGCGNLFGYNVISKFLQQNNLLCVVRAHEVKMNGYEEHWYKKWKTESPSHDAAAVPLCITLFSAPNYCDTHANSGAFLKLEVDLYTIQQFGWIDHPYVLPKFQNCFNFTFSFVLENVLHFLIKTMEVLSSVELEEEEKEEEEQQQEQEQQQQRLVSLRKRILIANTKMLSLRHSKQSNIDSIDKPKIEAGKPWFETVKEMDKDNEKLVKNDE